jgi:dTDP-4-dehydrorhamnose 3,5-epimerase
MQVANTEIADVKLITPKRFADDRGWFEEIYRKDVLQDAGIQDLFVQDNMSFSARGGTIRGLHFQLRPSAQAKLVGVLAGTILDVAVDLRRTSPTYGRHVGVLLNAVLGQLLYVPVGFAHGFCTLENNTLVTYKTTAYYNQAADRSLAWNDAALGIQWPVSPEAVTLSPKDRDAPLFADLGEVF